MKKLLFAFLAMLIIAFLVSAALIGEVWVPGEKDEYQYPQPQVVETKALKVGESYQIPEILLGDNEKIDHIEVSDEDILKLEGQQVTALGEFFDSHILVYTSEQQIEQKQPRYSKVSIFGLDLTDAFNGYRSWVRDLLHIEEYQPPRTELRTLRIFEYDFEIADLSEKAIRTESLAAITVDESRNLAPEITLDTFVSSIVISNPDVIRVEEDNGSYRLTGLKEGEARVSFLISRSKSLTQERYEAYSRYQQEKGKSVSPDPDKVEVAVRRIDFNISVKEKKQSSDTPVSGEKVYFTTSKGFTGYTQGGCTYIEGLLIVNKTYTLPSTYGNGLTSTAKTAFNKMKAAAAEDGITLKIVSGFRSYEYQTEVYNRNVNKEGKAKADTHSARPGHSEHQAGLAMDINSLKQEFDQTAEFAWLQANAYKYGFIMRYPQGKTSSTGYIYEPWHYRYVGTSWAEIFYNNGNWITVEDYFGITSRYSD